MYTVHIYAHTNMLRNTYIDSILEKAAAAKSLSRCGSIPVMSTQEDDHSRFQVILVLIMSSRSVKGTQ